MFLLFPLHYIIFKVDVFKFNSRKIKEINMSEQITQAVITCLAVINPAISAMILLQLTTDVTSKERVKVALSSMFETLCILTVVAFVGRSILEIFGISIEAFQVVGGVVIAYIGFNMLAGKMADSGNKEDSVAGSKVDKSPLVMFAASPGTVATVITISLVDGDSIVPVITLSAIFISLVITSIVLVVMSQFPPKKKAGPSYASKFMGLILIAMGVQYILAGIKDFMAF